MLNNVSMHCRSLTLLKYLGQFTSFGECGHICRGLTHTCQSVREWCNVCRTTYGGECVNIQGATFQCVCENSKKIILA